MATPASTGLIPSTWMVPVNDRVLVSPADKCPTSQVNIPSSMVAPPVGLMFSWLGISLVTITSFNETAETFSTSNSIIIGPPSPPFATDKERS